MNSNGKCEILNLDRDLPTNEADILALRKSRFYPMPDLQSYIDFLASLPVIPDRPRPSRGARGDAPFEL